MKKTNRWKKSTIFMGLSMISASLAGGSLAIGTNNINKYVSSNIKEAEGEQTKHKFIENKNGEWNHYQNSDYLSYITILENEKNIKEQMKTDKINQEIVKEVFLGDLKLNKDNLIVVEDANH